MFASQSSALKPFEYVLETVSKHYDGWEISAEYKHSLYVIEEKFKELTPSYNMKFQAHAPLSDINIASPNDNVRRTVIQEIINCIRIANNLGIEIVTFHPGFISPLTIDDRSLTFKLNRESISEIDLAGKEFGVKLALENMPKMFQTIGTSVDIIKEFIQETEIKICFDFGHANIARTIDEFIEDKDLFINIHIHDNDGKKDSHLVPGKGNIDFEKYMKRLHGYTGNFIFEANSIDEGLRSRELLLELVNLSL